MVLVIHSTDSAANVQGRIKKLNKAAEDKRNKKLSSLFGKLKFKGDPLKLQKEWRAVD